MDILLFPAIDSISVDSKGVKSFVGTKLSLGLDDLGKIMVSNSTYSSAKTELVSQFLKILLTEKGSVVTSRGEGTLFMNIAKGNSSQDTFAPDISACIIDADSQIKSYYSPNKKTNILNSLSAEVRYFSSNLIYADYTTGKVAINITFSDKTTSAVNIVGRIT